MRKSKSTFRLGRRFRALLGVLSLLSGVLAFTAVTASPAAALDNIVYTDDVDGPDDVPAQTDVTRLGFDDSHLPDYYVAQMQFDDTAYPGGNSGDGCIFFDSDDSGGFSDFAVCGSFIQNTTTGQVELLSAALYDCKGSEPNNDEGKRCGFIGGGGDGSNGIIAQDLDGDGVFESDGDGNPLPTPYDTTCSLNTTAPDPFNGVGTHNTSGEQDPITDTQLTCLIYADELVELDGDVPTGIVVSNACSFTSPDPGSESKDCIVEPGAGFLQIIKNTTGGDATFDYTVDGAPFASVTTSGGTGSTETIPLVARDGVILSEVVPDGWQLDSASCDNGDDPSALVIEGAQTVVCTFTNSLTFVEDGQIEITKTADSTTVVSGGSVTYTYEVTTGTGNVPISNVAVSDDKCTPVSFVSGDANTDLILDLDETWTYSCTTSLTQATTNIGTATGTTPSNTDVSDTDTAFVDVVIPSLLLDKTASPATYDTDGQIISYSYLVTNDGDVPLAGPVTVVDDKATVTCPDMATVGNGDANLDPGESVTCSASYTISQADIDAGSVTNNATATADGVDSNEDTETVTAEQNPSLSLVKSASPTTYDTDGQVISYSYLVTNNGNTTLAGPVTVVDNRATVDCPDVTSVGNGDGNLDPGESVTCSASYTISQADIDAGSVTNNATASADGVDSNEDTETVNAVANPAMTLAKTGSFNDENADGLADVGETISYSFIVTNTGNVTLSNITIDDPGTTISGGPITLGPTESDSTSFIGSYTITQADIDAGSYMNTATVTGDCSDGTEDCATATDDHTEPLPQNPSLLLDKETTTESYSAVGDVISYSYLVTNDGNTTLAGPVTVVDDKATVDCPDVTTVGDLDGNLDPGESVSCSATYTVDQADIDAGSVTNTATATADGVDSNDDMVTVDAVQNPLIDLAKSGVLALGADGVANPTDAIVYTFTVKNTGNVTLTNVTVTDPLPGLGDIMCDGGSTNVVASLAPGDSFECQAVYLLTQDDIDAGSVDNTATATGKPPTGDDVADSDPETIDIPQNPLLSITKDAEPLSFSAVDDVISYTIIASNDGNVTLDPVTVSDPNVDNLTCTPANGASLAPGDTIECTGTHTVTQDDIDAGAFANTACVDDGEGGAAEVCADKDVPADQNPGIEITKTGSLTDGDGDGFADVGEIISYSFSVENTGNVTLSNITIDDPGTSISGGPLASLAPGLTDTTTFTGSYVITQADIDAGSYMNTATVTGDCPTSVIPSEDCATDSDDHTEPLPQNPSVLLDKQTTTENYSAVGDVISYSYLVTNDGNTTLAGPVTVDDDRATVTCPDLITIGDLDGDLDVGEEVTCNATYVVDQADLDAGSVTNVATASAGGTTSNEDTETVPAVQTPGIQVIKSGEFNDENGDGYADEGETISYTFSVRNTGNVTLFNVTLTDPGAVVSGGPLASLAPGITDTTTFTGLHTLTQSDVDTGSYANTALVSGDCPDSIDPPEGCATDDDEKEVELPQNPAIEVVKSGTFQDEDGDGFADVDETIAYSFTVTNTGNVTLSNITISDSGATVSGGPLASLAPGASDGTTFTGSYTITQADIDAGSYANTALVTADCPDGTPDCADDEGPDDEPLPQNPELSINKLTNGVDNGTFLEGTPVIWTYEVTNTGNVTLNALTVTDDQGVTVTCLVDTLAVGASTTCEGAGTAVSGDYDNIGTASAADPQGDPAEDQDPSGYFGAAPSVAITKTFADDSVTAGGAASSFNIVVTNDGNVDLADVSITDTVDSRLNVTSVTSADADCVASSGQVVDCATSIAAGDSVTITVNFDVASDVPEADGPGGLNEEDAVSNSATASSIYTDDGGNTADLREDATDTVDIVVDIDLAVTKTFDPSEVPQGTIQSFTIDVSNTGPSDAVGVTVGDLVDDSIDVQGVTLTSGSGDCSTSIGQQVDCTVDISAEQSVTITVDYVAAPFLDDSSGNLGGDDFRFVFVNGSVLEGSTATGKVFLDGVDVSADVTIIAGLNRNDVVFDPPGPDPAFELHLSCSDPFTGGWGQSGGPVEGVDTNWQIAYFSIARFNNNGFIKNCGNVTNPFDVPNTATATGEDSFGTETASDNATLTIGPGITLDRLQTNGKRLTVRLTNFTGEEKEITDISIDWPGSNGNLTKIRLDDPTVWQGTESPPSTLLDGSDAGWDGGTLATGEGILRFDFKNKSAKTGYTIRVNFTDGTFLDINQ